MAALSVFIGKRFSKEKAKGGEGKDGWEVDLPVHSAGGGKINLVVV